MMTSPNGNIFRVTGHLYGEFPGEFPSQRPVTRSFDVVFDLRLNERLSKQSRGWWFETLSRPLWRYCNEVHFVTMDTRYSLFSGRTKWATVETQQGFLISLSWLGPLLYTYMSWESWHGYAITSIIWHGIKLLTHALTSTEVRTWLST